MQQQGEGVQVRLQGGGVRGAQEGVGGADGGEGGEGERRGVDERAGVVDEVLARYCVRQDDGWRYTSATTSRISI